MYFRTPRSVAEVCGCGMYFLSEINAEKEEERETLPLHHAGYTFRHVHVVSVLHPGKLFEAIVTAISSVKKSSSKS